MAPLTALGDGPTGLAAGLKGLPQVGDRAPQCRTQCAQEHYVCDGDACDTRWAQCVAGCATP
jgi:hypothetical protein